MEAHSKIMSKDTEILEVIKELAKTQGNRITLPLLYRSVVKKGIYTSSKAIQSMLKKLEICGKIKTNDLNSIELVE